MDHPFGETGGQGFNLGVLARHPLAHAPQQGFTGAAERNASPRPFAIAANPGTLDNPLDAGCAGHNPRYSVNLRYEAVIPLVALVSRYNRACARTGVGFVEHVTPLTLASRSG
jgi:hypothetical protein